MKAAVHEQGVLIPKRLLKGVKAVEIRKERGRIIVLPLKTDPIRRLGRHPVSTGLGDGAERHDDYLYGPV